MPGVIQWIRSTVKFKSGLEIKSQIDDREMDVIAPGELLAVVS